MQDTQEQEATQEVESGQEPTPTEETPETPVEGQEGQEGEAEETDEEEAEEAPADVESLKRKLSATNAEAAQWRVQLREAQAKLSEAKTPEQVAEITKELTERADALESELLRTKVAGKFGLPADLAARLQGADEAALEADAKVLARYAGGSTQGSGGLDPLDGEDPLPSGPKELASRLRGR